jgi:hypothetical protein
MLDAVGDVVWQRGERVGESRELRPAVIRRIPVGEIGTADEVVASADVDGEHVHSLRAIAASTIGEGARRRDVGDIEKESHREHACGAPEP